MFGQKSMYTPFGTSFGFSNSQYMQNSSIFGNNYSKAIQTQTNQKLEREPVLSLIGLGDPIVDISAEVDNQTVKRYGLEWGRTVYVNERTIGIFEELEKKDQVSYIPGGSVQNTIRVLAKLINKNENTKNKFKISMIGCVGGDNYREKIINALNICGVNPILETIPNLKTSRCGACIYKKERCLITELDASKNLSNNFIEQNMEEILKHDAIIIEGYLLQSKLDMCKKLSEIFNKNNKIVIQTLSAVFMVQNHIEKIMEIANMADIIVGNIEEIEVFAGGPYTDKNDTFEAIHKKLSRKNRLLVVTNGAKSTFCSKYDYENNVLEFVISCFPKKIKNEDIVDLNGAGDAFLGGFLCGYIQGKCLVECLKNGNDAAGLILKNVGCTFPKNY